MKLNKKLLEEHELNEMHDRIDPSDDMSGLYNNLFFFMRLRPDVYDLVKRVIKKEVITDRTEFEQYQAMSTFYHENWHWWQFIGSTSGLISSLSFPAQVTTCLIDLKKHLKVTGRVKPIITYSNNRQNKRNTNKDEFKIINTIINQFEAIKFYKIRMKRPKALIEMIHEGKAEHFNSVGYSYYSAYISAVMLLRTIFDKNQSFLPNPHTWVNKFNLLQKNGTKGYYKGSLESIPVVGTEALYEGQARFNQLLYLYMASNKNIDLYDFKQVGMLEGKYYSAFKFFLSIVNQGKTPSSVSSPLVALYLLLIDIAINPTEGFPFDIVNDSNFIVEVDPGIRFVRLCHAVNDDHSEFKIKITDYSSEEYVEVSTALCKTVGYQLPANYEERIKGWCENEEGIIKLLEENRKFDFANGNTLVRIIFGRFLSFQLDKFLRPDFFCWPGAYMHNLYNDEDINRLHFKHFTLFREDDNGRIRPAKLTYVDGETILKTSTTFYQTLGIYDICRQWIYDKGDFNFKFEWVSEGEDVRAYTKSIKQQFRRYFGVSPRKFKIIKPKK